MIQKWSLSAYPIDYNQDFAIIGNGESASKYQFDPGEIKIFTINYAARFMKNNKTIDIVTMYHHEARMVQAIGILELDVNLIIIQLSDISKHHLPSGDTANMLIHYLVHKMKSWGVRDKKIYLTGFDFSYQKDWKPQIESLKYCQVMAEYNNIDIVCTSENKQLDFLKHEEPLSIYLRNSNS